LECYGESVDQEVTDVFFVEVFEFDDKGFEQIGIGERDDNSFQDIAFAASTLDTGLIVFGESMTVGADFLVWLKLSFASFAKIFALLSAGDTVSGEKKVYEFHSWSIYCYFTKYTDKVRTKVSVYNLYVVICAFFW